MSFHFSPRIVRDGLVTYLDAANTKSFAGSGFVFNDLTKNQNHSQIINGYTFTNDNAGCIVLDGIDEWVTIPFIQALDTPNFTWQAFHYYISKDVTLDGIWWSENLFVIKNFLMTYRNVDLPSIMLRIDTPTTSYRSDSFGTQSNGLGSNAGPIIGKWIFTTIVKNGTNFKLYWNNAMLMWDVNIPDWNIVNRSQPITFGVNSGLNGSNIKISNIIMYNRDLTTFEIQQNYNALKGRYGL